MLYGLLASGAALAASAGAGEAGKQAVASAFAAVKARLSGAHRVQGLDLLDKPGFAEGVKAELARPEIAADDDLARRVEALRAAIAALPTAETARYAVDVQGAIEAARNVAAEDIEGLRAASVTAHGGDVTLRNVTAPPGNA